VLFRQFVDDDLGCGSYLVGDVDAGEAIVVDPAFAIEQYLDAARARACACPRARDAHPRRSPLRATAASRSSTAPDLRSIPLARPEYAFDPLDDGQVLRVGSVECASCTRRATGRSTVRSSSTRSSC
jgi:glyoxylase-like metal-dependent hydrolase (beta-lactamase superfamily II)